MDITLEIFYHYTVYDYSCYMKVFGLYKTQIFFSLPMGSPLQIQLLMLISSRCKESDMFLLEILEESFLIVDCAAVFF